MRCNDLHYNSYIRVYRYISAKKAQNIFFSLVQIYSLHSSKFKNYFHSTNKLISNIPPFPCRCSVSLQSHFGSVKNTLLFFSRAQCCIFSSVRACSTKKETEQRNQYLLVNSELVSYLCRSPILGIRLHIRATSQAQRSVYNNIKMGATHGTGDKNFGYKCFLPLLMLFLLLVLSSGDGTLPLLVAFQSWLFPRKSVHALALIRVIAVTFAVSADSGADYFGRTTRLWRDFWPPDEGKRRPGRESGKSDGGLNI